MSRGPGGGKRATVGERRRAAAARALGVTVNEKQRLDAANERAHELYGYGIGLIVMEGEAAKQLAVSLASQMGEHRWGPLSRTWRSLRRQARRAAADAAMWEGQLAHVASDLVKRSQANVACSPGER